MTCDIGDPIILRAVFKKRAGTNPNSPLEAFEPAKVICTVEKPDGTILKPAVEPESGAEAEKGAYVARRAPDTDGTWEYAFDGYDEDDEPDGSVEGTFKVRKRKVPRD